MKKEPHCKLQKNDKRNRYQTDDQPGWSGEKIRLTPGFLFSIICWTALPVMDFFDLTVSVKGRYRSRFPPYDRRYRNRAWSRHRRSFGR